MIVSGMKLLELCIGQIGDRAGITPRIMAVGIVWEECLFGIAIEHVVRGRVSPLHLVKDDAFVGRRRINIFQFVVPSLLL